MNRQFQISPEKITLKRTLIQDTQYKAGFYKSTKISHFSDVISESHTHFKYTLYTFF